jgi:hypothetical protein
MAAAGGIVHPDPNAGPHTHPPLPAHTRRTALKTMSIGLLVAALAAIATVEAAPATDKAAVAAIQSATKGKMKAAKGTAKDRDCGQVDYEAEAVDLNGDGQLEVLTKEYGSCFGRAGVQMNMYVKDKTGPWKAQFGFPGEPKILKAKSHGFPDIEILGPGTCFPVWRYDGRQYQVIKKCR